MLTAIVAEAGLSECVREKACDPNFGQWYAILGGAWVLGAVWLAVSFYATVDVLFAKVGIVHTVLWLILVWILPILGAIAWFRDAAVAERDPGDHQAS